MCHSNTQDEDSVPMCHSNTQDDDADVSLEYKHHDAIMPMCHSNTQDEDNMPMCQLNTSIMMRAC